MYNSYPSDYTTYDAVNDQIKGLASGADMTADQTTIVGYIRDASRLINMWCNRTFVPYISDAEQKEYCIDYKGIQPLPDDMLSLTSVADTSGTTVTASTYRVLSIARELSGYPYGFLEFSTLRNFSYTDTDSFSPSFTFDGIFGFSDRSYANSWVSRTTMNNGGQLSASATSIILTSVTNIDTLDYIRIEDEFMQVTAIDTDTNTVTVLRGVNGSTAATHDDSTTVYVWLVNDAIRLACTRLSAWLYSSRQNEHQQITFNDGTVAGVNYPAIVQTSLLGYIKPLAESV